MLIGSGALQTSTKNWRIGASTTTKNAHMGRSATSIYVAESRWRSQPAIVKEPENSTRWRSKVRPHCKLASGSTMNRRKQWRQVLDFVAQPWLKMPYGQ